MVMDCRRSTLKILYWNARGVQSKTIETFDYLVVNGIDVALFQETNLKPGHSFTHSDYSCYRLDRLDARCGGVAIAIRKTIRHSLLPSFNLQIIECIGVNVESTDGPINLISPYFPGTDVSRQAMIDYKDDIKKLTRLNESYLICGDLNAKHRLWNCKKGNRAGAIIYELLGNGRFTISHPPEPTHYPSQRGYTPSTIDIVLTNGKHGMTQPTIASPGLFSDHQPVEFFLHCDSKKHTPSHYIPCYHKANWKLYQQYLNEQIDISNFSLEKMTSPAEVDLMIDKLTIAIQEAKQLAVPLVQPHFSKIVFPDELRAKIHLRKTLGRIWNRYHRPVTKALINYLSSSIKSDINFLRNHRFSLLLENINSRDGGPNKLWKTAKIIKNQVKYTPPLKVDGNVLLTDLEKAEALSNQFSKSHEITIDYVNRSTDTDVQNSMSFLNNCGPNEMDAAILTKPAEVKETVRRLKNNKAPGQDRIPNILLKKLPLKAFVYITYIINSCIYLSYFPDCWKEADVTAVPKPAKDLSKPQSYRPISLLNAMSKVFERIMLNRIDKLDETLDTIPDFQFGFRKFHSTVHQAYRLTHHIRTGFMNGMSTGMVLFDGEKAFDTIWHDGLIHKMLKFGYPIYLVRLIQSFLKGRKFRVKVNKTKSESKSIPAGVPQGSCLSPKLYNLYISDFPLMKDILVAYFADDLAILTTSKSRDLIQKRLQVAISKIHSYLTKWKLKINPDKTQAIYFTRRRKQEFLPNRKLTVNNIEVEWLTQVKYLGITFDKKLNFSNHVTNVIQKTQKYIKIFYPFTSRKAKLFKKTKILLFKVVFQAIMRYGAPVWQSCAATHKNKLQIQQNKILKMAMDLPFHFSTVKLHQITKVKKIANILVEQTIKFKDNCRQSTNPLISEMID